VQRVVLDPGVSQLRNELDDDGGPAVAPIRLDVVRLGEIAGQEQMILVSSLEHHHEHLHLLRFRDVRLRHLVADGIEADERKFAQLQRAYKNLPNAVAVHQTADPDNIVALLQSLDIEKDFSVLSLDIDGNDYWVLKAILSEFRPTFVVTEINEKIPPPLRFLFKYERNAQLRHHFFGYSIAVLEDLCEEFNYGLLELEYNNAFIAPRELKGAKFLDAEKAYVLGYRDRPDRKQRFASNLDMEILHSLSPAKGISFLKDFYAKESGKYYLAPDREMLAIQLEER